MTHLIIYFFNGGSDTSGKYNDYYAENCISIS